MVLQQVSLVERLSLSQRVPYRRFHCIHVFCIVFHWSQEGDEGGESVTPALDFHMEKVKTTIKQFYRDWSSEVKY